jgi:hypothetical protein
MKRHADAKPKTPPDSNDEPLTYFELQRRRDANPEIGAGEISGAMPRLPASSPWSTSLDEVSGKEPPLGEIT